MPSPADFYAPHIDYSAGLGAGQEVGRAIGNIPENIREAQAWPYKLQALQFQQQENQRTLALQHAFPNGLPTKNGQIDLDEVSNTLARIGGPEYLKEVLPYLYAGRAASAAGDAMSEADQIARGASPRSPNPATTAPDQPAPQPQGKGLYDYAPDYRDASEPTPAYPPGETSSASGPAAIIPPKPRAVAQASVGDINAPAGGPTSGAPAPTARAAPTQVAQAQPAENVRPPGPPSQGPVNRQAQNLRKAASYLRTKAGAQLETPYNKGTLEGWRKQADVYDDQAKALEEADIRAREPTGDIKQYQVYANQQRQLNKPVASFNQWQAQNEAEKAGAKKQAEDDLSELKDLRTAGLEAKQQLAQFANIEKLSGRVGYGAGPMIQQWLGKWGVATAGLSEIQAYQAAIDFLAPRLRQEGSGRLLATELDAFKASLGGLSRTPEGRAVALNNLKAIAQYKAQIGAIANDTGLSPAGRMEKIYSLEPPELVTELPKEKTTAPSAPPTVPKGATDWASGPNGEVAYKVNGKWINSDGTPLKK
jgi:hypothetical protein